MAAEEELPGTGRTTGTGRPLHHPGPVLSSERGGSGSGLDSVDGRPAALTALRRVRPLGPAVGYPPAMSGEPRPCVFLRILLGGPRLLDGSRLAPLPRPPGVDSTEVHGS